MIVWVENENPSSSAFQCWPCAWFVIFLFLNIKMCNSPLFALEKKNPSSAAVAPDTATVTGDDTRSPAHEGSHHRARKWDGTRPGEATVLMTPELDRSYPCWGFLLFVARDRDCALTNS